MLALMRPPLAFAGAALAIGVLALAGSCKAPIPNRAEEEADAAWNAAEWRDDYGDVWRVRTNSRRVSATETAPDSGLTLRGAIAEGVLTFSVLDKGGQEIGKGEAKVADPSHALFHMFDMSGKETSHGLWHFDHAPSGASPIPTPAASPSIAASPNTPAPVSPAAPSPSPSDSLSASPDTSSPTPSPSDAPATPTKPSDPLDLRPH